jgi:predicted RecA/RadA family phage recombinase
MKNFVKTGVMLGLVAPYAVSSGDGMLVGAIFAVAASAAPQGVEVEARREGVFVLPALNTDVGAQGAKIYWDNANRRVTVTAAGNVLVGALTTAKSNGDAAATVLLDAVIR